jgi:hypothetical protein
MTAEDYKTYLRLREESERLAGALYRHLRDLHPEWKDRDYGGLVLDGEDGVVGIRWEWHGPYQAHDSGVLDINITDLIAEEDHVSYVNWWVKQDARIARETQEIAAKADEKEKIAQARRVLEGCGYQVFPRTGIAE